MIEIEAFQREPTCGVHTLKVWVNGDLVFANEICSTFKLVQLRDELHNELLWLNEHLRELGVEE